MLMKKKLRLCQKSYQLSKLLKLIILLFLAVSSYADNLFRVNAYNIEEISSLSVSDSSLIQIRTPEGLVKIKLKRISYAAPLQSVNENNISKDIEIKLYTGKVLRKKNRQYHINGVSADIIGDTLRINFYGNRGKLYRLRTSLKNKKRLYRLRHVSSHVSVACAVAGSNNSPTETFMGEPLPVFSPNLVLQLGTDADREFYLNNSKSVAETNAKILAIVNTVNSIYQSQLGVEVQVVAQNVFTKKNQPYNTSDAEKLLTQFVSTTQERKHIVGDVKHLFTGKNLSSGGSSGVIGLAYVGTTCVAPNFAYGLTEHVSNSLLQPLITAHEIGHNLNANHDAANLTTLMAPVASSSNNTFSAFSIEEISSFINQYGSCLNDVRPELSLQVVFKSTNSFRLISRVLNDSAKDCVINFYGSAKKERLDGIYSRAKFLGKVNGRDLNKKVRLIAKNMTKTTKKKSHYQARVSCGAYSALSPIVSLKKRRGSSRLEAKSVVKFLRQVKNKAS